MSGMRVNVTAFTTVWTYDITSARSQQRQRPSLREHGPVDDGDWVSNQRGHGVFGDAVREHHGLCAGLVQLFFIAPLFGTFVLGML